MHKFQNIAHLLGPLFCAFKNSILTLVDFFHLFILLWKKKCAENIPRSRKYSDER